ncbi:DUF861 domain-containing protein [Methylovulum psychrotolerans]|nr:DUF861 domain-containing protein [Methylovulum psychrotolerans]
MSIAAIAHCRTNPYGHPILEGEIIVTPAGGEPVRILPGDLVVFHAGLDSHWEVVKPLRKHYSYD